MIGSNVGANFTIIGALAGIMWASLLRERGLEVGYLRFAKEVMPAGAACAAAGLLVLWAEFAAAG